MPRGQRRLHRWFACPLHDHKMILVPFRLAGMRRELALYSTWYNEHRPHAWLGGRTPAEVYDSLPPATALPRFEPRSRWPCGVGKRKGAAGVRLSLCLAASGIGDTSRLSNSQRAA